MNLVATTHQETLLRFTYENTLIDRHYCALMMLGVSSYMMCGNGYCSWKNHRHLGCHTTRKTSGKYPRVHCGCYVRLVMDSSAKCMKVCGTTQRKLPWKLSNLVSTYASSNSYCAILQSAVSFYVSCHFQWCSYSDSVHSALCEWFTLWET